MRLIIILFVFFNIHFLYAQENYNLNKTFIIIRKFDNLLSSDNKEYVFYIDASYLFSPEGKSIYSNNIYMAKKALENNSNDIVYSGVIKSSTPPENYVYLLLHKRLYDYISKNKSSYIDELMQTDLQTFYDNIREYIIKEEIYTGNFKYIRFLTKTKYKYYTGKD